MKIIRTIIAVIMHCQILYATELGTIIDHPHKTQFLHEFSDQEIKTTFPNVQSRIRKQIIESSKASVSHFKNNSVTIQYEEHRKPQQGSKIHGGSNFLTLSDMHIKALRNSVDKDILEIGSGYGLYSMYFCFNAASIHLLEVSTDCTNYIQHQITQNHLPWSRSNVTIENADVTNPSCSISIAKYDEILMFNILHYMNPTNAIIALSKAKIGLKDHNARIFVIMDTVAFFKQDKIIEHYLMAEEEGIHFPGFLRYYFTGDYEPHNCDKKEILFAFRNEEADTEIDPMTVLKKIDSSSGKTDQSIITFFGGDIASMRRLCFDSGLSIANIYYQSPKTGEIFRELTYDIINIHESIKLHAELKLPD